VGVAVQIVNGVDTLQQILLVLCTIVCILAIGSAGVLVGAGRRKEALFLRQLGWQSSLLISVFALDGLLLCLPASILIVGWTLVAMKLWVSEISVLVTWGLLGVGVMVYCYSLVVVSCFRRGRRRKVKIEGASKILATCLALTSTTFLIVIEYLLITNFDQTLVVTILGRQVREVLEGPQLLLLLVIVMAAFLTVGFCTKLLLQGRREELSLLARVGWERRDVLWHIVRENWIMALGSGALGTLLVHGG
jgi:cell division protein FtsX